MRLTRVGKKKQPSYRVVVTDQRKPRDSEYVEVVGHYNPVRQPAEVDFKPDRIHYWLAKGAQPTETVRSLLRRQKLM